MDTTTYRIRNALQISHGYNLLIAAGNFWQGEYADQEGAIQTGLTCGLVITIRDESVPHLSTRVHTGQEIHHGHYVIKIAEIDRDDDGPYVLVGVSEVAEPAAEWAETIAANGQAPYEIPENVQMIYDDDNLLIGAGNFAAEKYDAEAGTYGDEAEGQPIDTSVLWLDMRDGSVPAQHMRVHTGQEISYGAYTIRVIEVRGDLFRLAEDISRKDFVPTILVEIVETKETKN